MNADGRADALGGTEEDGMLRPDGRRLRVALLGPYPKEEGKIQNGVQAATYYLSEGLAGRADLDVHVITSVSGLASEQERESLCGAKVHLLPLSERLGCLTGFAVDRSRIREAMRRVKPDLVHVHTQTMYPFAALERGYPSVLTPHGVFFKEADLFEGFVDRFQSRLGCLYERNALRRARHIILLNRYLANVFGDLLKGPKLHFIDNPVDDKFFDVPDETEAGDILFVGVLIERKGLLHLAEAASILKAGGARFKIRVVGPVGDQDCLNRVKGYVSENRLDDCFDFLGMVSEEEVMNRYARCSMLVLPSFEETAPMVISQAQAAGRPVVATAVGGIPEMVEDDVTGYTVAFGDAEALADRIGRLLADPDKARRMGQAARRTAEERYRRSVVVDKTLEVYRQVMADAAG